MTQKVLSMNGTSHVPTGEPPMFAAMVGQNTASINGIGDTNSISSLCWPYSYPQTYTPISIRTVVNGFIVTVGQYIYGGPQQGDYAFNKIEDAMALIQKVMEALQPKKPE